MSAAVQACQDSLLSPFKEGATRGWDKGNNSADSQGGGSQVAYALAARMFLGNQNVNVQHHLEITNCLVS